MKAIGYIATLFLLSGIFGCGGTQSRDVSGAGIQFSEREAYRYDKALKAVEQVESLCQQVAHAPSQELITNLQTQAKALKYNYNDEGMNAATVQHCDSLKRRVEHCQKQALTIAEQGMLLTGSVSIIDVREQLLTEPMRYPMYLKKGEKLFCKIKASEPLSVKLYNADTERLIKAYQKNEISDSITIANTGIYLIEITPQGRQYANISLGFRPTDATEIYNRPAVSSEQVECKKGDFGAVGVQGVSMREAFEEPRKFTLRGQLKATFSGNAIALVPVQIPAGATDILYSVRIDTDEYNSSSDGRFHENLNISYKKVRFLGMPLYEKTNSSGLLNALLEDNRPRRDEEAYCNMYVFRNQSQAKQFQDGTKPASELNYDVDYSTLGTQSCNGRIPVKGSKTIYLGFENARMRYTNYLWVEVEAVVPTTEYYRTKYSVGY